jgi:hypothetical protein
MPLGSTYSLHWFCLTRPGLNLATILITFIFSRNNNHVQTAISPDIPKNLGPSVASYGPRRRRWREAWVWPFPGFILACILIITGLDWYYYGYTQYGPIAAQAWSQDWLFWGILIGSVTLIVTAWQVFQTRVRVYLFRYGIEVHLPRQAPQTLRWEDITGIASATIQDCIWGRAFRTRHRLTIHLTQGKPLTFDDRVDNLLELTTRLKANLYPRLLPGFRIRFQAGQQLAFGPVSIQASSIMIRERQHSWEYVNRITILAGNLVIETRIHESGNLKSFRLPVIQIPNLELLFQVLQRGLNQQL